MTIVIIILWVATLFVGAASMRTYSEAAHYKNLCGMLEAKVKSLESAVTLKSGPETRKLVVAMSALCHRHENATQMTLDYMSRHPGAAPNVVLAAAEEAMRRKNAS